MKCVPLFVLTLMAMGGVARAAEPMRVAVVDLRRAVAETAEGRRVTAELKRSFDSKQKELDQRQQELRRAMEDLERQRSLLAPEAVRKQESDLQARAQALRQLLERHQEELGRKQAQALEAVLGRMHRIVAGIAEAEQLSLVLDRAQVGVVVFARAHLDITNELIRRFDAGESRAAPRPGAKP
jgi:outer membrane protein